MVNAKAQNDSARGGACFYRERDAEVVSDGSMPLIRVEMAVLCPNGLQHCSMPPFGRGLQVIVLKLPRFQKDESVEIRDVQLVAMRHQLGHLIQDTMAERQDGYNIGGLQAVQLLPKLHEKVHKFGEVGASVIKHDRTKSLFVFHRVSESTIE
ncbi:hypothetical protein NPIL_466491 [Nephila pilipes]|uniref:Uncharacterized protein n=1 Tax=Nephila pilipes TaxID=299642 RepID=A0A8X6ME67_NEPPI|nr:hypothetical protein NPIL_144521 [Nephila pilipes]GFU26577.1 hypothetical protein NPIL_466491 [Nephila pilipes]